MCIVGKVGKCVSRVMWKRMNLDDRRYRNHTCAYSEGYYRISRVYMHILIGFLMYKYRRRRGIG